MCRYKSWGKILTRHGYENIGVGTGGARIFSIKMALQKNHLCFLENINFSTFFLLTKNLSTYLVYINTVCNVSVLDLCLLLKLMVNSSCFCILKQLNPTPTPSKSFVWVALVSYIV